MSSTRTRIQEGLHLLALKAAVYAGVVLLFAFPLSTWSGIASALAAIPAALLLSRWLANTRLHLPVLAAAGIGLAVLGLNVDEVLGSQGWYTRWLGYQTAMASLEGLKFGLLTFGILFTLRTMSLRWPALALLEVALVVGIVVWSFADHRDGQMGQPQQLSDWALSRGYDPLLLVLGVGLLTAAGLAMLLLRGNQMVKTMGTLLVLVGIGAVGHLWLQDLSAKPPVQDDEQQKETPPGGKRRPPRLIAVVLLKEEYQPSEERFYFRETSFSRFNGQRLVASELNEEDDQNGAGLAIDPSTPRPLIGRQTIKTQVAELEEQSKPLMLVNGSFLGNLENPDPEKFKQTYEVSSQVLLEPTFFLTRAKFGNPSWTAQRRQQYLELPTDPRYAKLVAEIAQSMKPRDRNQPMMKVLATRRWIEKNVTYSKRPSPTGNLDPTTAFLFGDRRGFCVHISHATAFLLRAQGIPARVSGGYAVNPDSRKGSTIGVYSNTGHAWCEVYLEQLGWMVIDPIPEKTEEEPDPRPDLSLISQLGEMARKKKAVTEPTEAGDAVDWSFTGLVLALGLGFGLPASLYLVKAWRRCAPALAGPQQMYRVAYRAVLDRLAEVGLVRHFGETREEFAQRVAPLAPAFVELSGAHVRQAVGGLASEVGPGWRQWMSQVEAALAQKFSRCRRIVGLLNPLSWWWAR